MQTLEKLLRDGIGSTHIGAQAIVIQKGEVITDLAVGEASSATPMNRDTLMLWMSSGKPLTAVAIAQLVELGRLELDMRVSEIIPEFAAQDKEEITIWHLLTHTCGFRSVRFRFPDDSWDDIISAICDAPLERDWRVGHDAGYHPQTSWYILAEIIQRAAGMNYSEYMHAQIFQPLGMDDAWIGMPLDRYRNYAEQGRIANMPTLAITTMRPTGDTGTSVECLTQPRPGGNFTAPCHQFARFYEALRCGGTLDGVTLIEPDTLKLWTHKQRRGAFDQTFRRIVDFGLGFICDSKEHLTPYEDPDGIHYGYGACASPQTFGHSGYQSSAAFCDPQHDLTVCLCFNGYPGEKAHNQRLRPVLREIYRVAGCIPKNCPSLKPLDNPNPSQWVK